MPRSETVIVNRPGSPAPDFNPGYPSGGLLIGPAWERLWTALEHGRWTFAADLAADRDLRGVLAEASIKILLAGAARAGYLERRLSWRVSPAGNRRKMLEVRRLIRAAE